MFPFTSVNMPKALVPVNYSLKAGECAYNAAATYNSVVEKTATVAGYVKDAGVGVAQFGLGALSTFTGAATDPIQAVKDWTYFSLGGNNFADAKEAIQKKPTVTETDKDGKQTTITDVRSLPQRFGEAGSHVFMGISKASTSAGYYPALALGTISNLVGMEVPVSEHPTSFDMFHTASKAVASVTSYAAGTLTSVAWSAVKMTTSTAYNISSTVVLNPGTTAQMANVGITTLGMAGSLYVATSNFTKAVDSDSYADKAKYSAMAVAGLVGLVSIPMIMGTREACSGLWQSTTDTFDWQNTTNASNPINASIANLSQSA